MTGGLHDALDCHQVMAVAEAPDAEPGTYDPARLAYQLRCRGLSWSDLPFAKATKDRLRKGRPIAPSTARRLVEFLRSKPVDPDHAVLLVPPR